MFGRRKAQQSLQSPGTAVVVVPTREVVPDPNQLPNYQWCNPQNQATATLLYQAYLTLLQEGKKAPKQQLLLTRGNLLSVMAMDVALSVHKDLGMPFTSRPAQQVLHDMKVWMYRSAHGRSKMYMDTPPSESSSWRRTDWFSVETYRHRAFIGGPLRIDLDSYVPLEDYPRTLPPRAILARGKLRDMGIPVDRWWVVTPVVAELPPNDPFLYAQFGEWYAPIAQWD